jgi:hypothetical protein
MRLQSGSLLHRSFPELEFQRPRSSVFDGSELIAPEMEEVFI